MQKIITRKPELFGDICRMENDKKIKSVVFGRLEGTNKRMDGQYNRMAWCINTRTIPRYFGETKMASNNENGIGHLWALVPWLMMMMTTSFPFPLHPAPPYLLSSSLFLIISISVCISL